MNWYSGTISDAINEAKSRNAVFMVFIGGDDDASKKMRSKYDETSIANKLSEVGVVAVAIKSDSAECNQFCQIYPIVVIPSCYYIANNGVPIEIIGGDLSADEILSKIDKISKAHKDILDGTKTSVQDGALSADSGASANGIVQPTQESKTWSESKPEREDETSNAKQEENEKGVTDRVKKAEEVIETKRQERAQMEKEKEKQQEVERRKLGKDVQKLKEKQKELEAKNIVDDLAKEKAEEKRAREHVRQQIARDREERATRFNKQKEELEMEKQEKSQEKLKRERDEAESRAAQRSTMARLQFRLPDGSSLNETFSADSSLDSVHQFAKEKFGGQIGAFSMSTTFPRRIFTENDFSQNLRDLQLAPSSVIIILPIKTSSDGSISTERFSSVLLALLAPFISIWNFIYNFLFGRPDQTPSQLTEQQQQQQNSSRVRKRRSTEEPSTSREGNVYRFRNDRGSDDENNTWNGNSTQQM